jgi:hypothetical protein
MVAVLALAGLFVYLRLRNKGVTGSGSTINYYIMRKVNDQWQVMPKGTGRVRVNAESFKVGGKAYHVDLAKVQQDAGGHQFLKYDLGVFEPLSKGQGDSLSHDDEGLETHASSTANMVLNTGFIRQLMNVVSGQSGIGMMTIIFLIMGGTVGFFAGSAFPIGNLLGTNSTPASYATIPYTGTGSYTTNGVTTYLTYTSSSLSKIPAGYYTIYSISTAGSTTTIITPSIFSTTSVSYVVQTVLSTIRSNSTSTYSTTLNGTTSIQSVYVYVPYNVTVSHTVTNSTSIHTTSTLTVANSTITTVTTSTAANSTETVTTTTTITT